MTGQARSVLGSFPAPRIKPYLYHAEGDETEALALYVWNSQMAGAVLEQIAHLEVLFRHAIDKQLSEDTKESVRGIPWFLLEPYYSAQKSDIEKVVFRLRAMENGGKHERKYRLSRSPRETRDQIIAGFSFGFWTRWFSSENEELWRNCLHKAFPNGADSRKEVAILVEQIRKFRNRVAHHDSLLNVDIIFEMRAVFALAEMIDKEAAAWMKSVDRTRGIGKRRPSSLPDVVVVEAKREPNSWQFYEQSRAYITQPGRFIRNVNHIAFYDSREIKPEIPRIKWRQDNIVWSGQEAHRLEQSDHRRDRRLGAIMKNGLDNGWSEGRYQVFVLSHPDDPEHVQLDGPLQNDHSDKSTDVIDREFYTSVHRLRHADDINDLLTSPDHIRHHPPAPH